MSKLNIFHHLETIDAKDVEELRRRVYAYAAAHPEEIDIKDVRSRIRAPDEGPEEGDSQAAIPNWMLKRLLITAKVTLNVDSAVERFVEVFKFRAQWKVNTLTSANTLPAEFYMILPFIAEGVDRKNNRLMIIRLKYYKKLPQFELILKRAIVCVVEQMDCLYEQEKSFNGLSLLMDFTDFNYLNVDLDLLHFMINLAYMYRGLVRNFFVFNLPFVLKAVLAVTQKLIDIKLKSLDSIKIDKYIAPEELPDFLGGHRSGTTDLVPEDTVSLEELLRRLENQIEPANAKKIIDYVKVLLQE